MRTHQIATHAVEHLYELRQPPRLSTTVAPVSVSGTPTSQRRQVRNLMHSGRAIALDERDGDPLDE